MNTLKNSIDWTRINNDINGNPRYVCHYLAFKPLQGANDTYVRFEYEEALKIAKKLGGRKFHNKQYGGGIVFQSYNIESLTEKILLLTGEAVNYRREPNAYELAKGYGSTHYRAFLRKDVLNRFGELKKWFKSKDDKLTYSRV